MFIEAVEMPPAICEIREGFNDPLVVPCAVIVDIDSPVSALLFDLGSFSLSIAGENMPYGRISADVVGLNKNRPSRSTGECQIKSISSQISCEFKLGDRTFYLKAQF